MTPDQSTRATAATRKPTLKKGSKPYLFHVESQSRPGLFHVTDAYRMTCTCEAGRARRLCWHVRLAVRCYDWWKSTQPTAQASIAPAAPKQTMQPVALSSYFE